MFYLYHLYDKMNNNALTGLEYIILDKVKDNEDVTWIPTEDDEEEETDCKIMGLLEELEKCRNQVRMIEPRGEQKMEEGEG